MERPKCMEHYLREELRVLRVMNDSKTRQVRHIEDCNKKIVEENKVLRIYEAIAWHSTD